MESLQEWSNEMTQVEELDFISYDGLQLILHHPTKQ
jgi:hypothetical protein